MGKKSPSAKARDHIDALTPKQWAEIHGLAIEIYRKGMFEGNQLKCNIAAFVLWEAVRNTAPPDQTGKVIRLRH